ncbi:MAG TPA: CTP--2,3-di-O-geranylgeranyl-sn-glycero-1-phosphate cytidyltransferase [Methanophagales archaeon]|nr:CTP--2,3-di-O-geranylgeranyl-sn-glycero-1-phosphate cytidyltransferase [Methanophagales archaeon]
MERQEISLKRELQRKVVHVTSLLIVVGYYILPKEAVLLIMTVFLILFLEIEFVRIDLKLKLPFFHKLYRAKEEDRLSGNVFFLIGAIIAVSVFSKEIAIAAILMTTFGDASAAIFGKRFGRTWIPKLKNRAVEGCMAEFVVDLLIGFVFLRSWLVILVMAGTATIVETVVNRIDDNLLIPLFSGFNAQILTYIISLGYLSSLPLV